ncbi:MAG: DUF4038 domain-containing protein [Hyphomonadaceae bacterium]
MTRKITRRTLSLGAAALLASCSQHAPEARAQGPEANWPRATYPLRVEGRHLVDADGRPFLLHGDTAWSLIAELDRDECETYLEDRRRRGFNTILVNLIEHRFAQRPPENAFGVAPFTRGDFSRPVDAYFDHARWCVERAAEKGMLVLLVPVYLGYNGGGEGWYQEALRNGRDRLRAFGRYVGERFRDQPNILWVQGADYNPPERWTVTAVVEGMHEANAPQLMSAHCGPETSARAFWGDADWIDVNTLYTYSPVYRGARAEYARNEPFFLIESSYEGAPRDLNPRRQRAQAYGALLSGACGHMFGNVDVWHYDGPGVVERTLPWRTALDSAGSRAMTHLRTLFDQLDWPALVPDPENDFLLDLPGDGSSAVVLARNARNAILYIPTPREFRLDLARLEGGVVAARWWNPVAGGFSEPRQLQGGRNQAFTTPPPGQDWVLVLQSV